MPCVFSTVRKLQLCDELDRSSCGNVLFNGYLPPPGTPEQEEEEELLSLTRECFTSNTSCLCRPSVPGEASEPTQRGRVTVHGGPSRSYRESAGPTQQHDAAQPGELWDTQQNHR